HDTGVLQPTTEEDIRRMMDLEQMKLMLACTDAPSSPASGKTPEEQCLSSFKQALGAKLLVTGTVGKAGDDVLISLTLIDLDKAVSLARETAQSKTATGIVSAVRGVLPKLVKPILDARSGSLAVLSNEEGATVLLDGAAVGTAPWRGEHVPAGPHRVEASKDGFIKSSVDVVVPPAGSGAIEVLLVPSHEFADAHKKTALIYRISAITGAGLAALSLGGGTALWVYQSQRTGDYAKSAALDNTGAILLPAGKFNEINSLRLTSYLLMGAAVPLAAVSGALFYLGDDPGKYDALFPAGAAPAGAAADAAP
ncbi:MAG TPA: PEGA domain-containing protein, partial [Myxococcota bacterium]